MVSKEQLDTGVETQAVNQTLLDLLAVDYLFHRGVLEENTNGELSEHSTKCALLQEIRHLIVDGNIAQAISRLQTSLPAVVQDPAILYRLQKQQFVELLRNGAVEDAICFARETLCKSALNAYPDSYYEFKATFILTLYHVDKQNSPASHEWSLARREELASAVHVTIMTALGIEESLLPLSIRYLCSVHNTFHFVTGHHPQFNEVDQLLLSERLPIINTTPFDNSIRIAEEDVRALVQILSISKAQAQDALRATRGSVSHALRNALSKIQLNHHLLTQLVTDYCDYRGLLSYNNVVLKSIVPLLARTNPKLKRSAAMMMGHEHTTTTERTMTSAEQFERLRRIRLGILNPEQDPNQVSVEVLELDPSFPSSFPFLFFRLKQREALRAIELGNYEAALNILRQSMGPIASKHPELYRAVVQTVMMVVYQTRNVTDAPSLSPPAVPNSFVLSGHVYSALCQSLQLAPPQFVRLMKYLLAVHSLHHDSPDRFEQLFRISALKKNEMADGEEAAKPSDFQKAASEVDTATAPPPAQQPASSARTMSEQELQEIAIATLMEVMRFPRLRAIELLQQTGYDLDAVFMELI